ncbi:hypothetical protein [Streptomyces variegatus]|jgi:hypothetical protein|uniref:hypothetical protein n=1 Tax=Streptomyces variegatus TaxID=284040 RepID=UPI003C2D00F5
MSEPFEYADGVTARGSQDPPNVYLPQAAAPPAYDAYADPAAAHGWQDVYDAAAAGDAGHPDGAVGADGAVSSRPRARPGDGADAAGARPGDAPGRVRLDGTGGADGTGGTRELPSVQTRGRSGAGRRARRKPAPRLARRVAVAVGAVGAVSAVALIAGASLSGTPSGGTRGGEGGRSAPTAGESPTAAPASSGPADTADAPLVAGPGDPDDPSGEASAPPSPTASRTPSASATDAASPPAGSPTAGATAVPVPTATTSAPGRSGEKPGRGPGGTKGPK